MDGIDLAIPVLLASFKQENSTPLALAQAVARQTAGFDSTFLQLEPTSALEARCRSNASHCLVPEPLRTEAVETLCVSQLYGPLGR